ncbi:MAG: rhodanese-like domain-containing protein [Bacteroidota bacterium]
MTKSNVWMLAILFLSFFVVSCDNTDDPEINEAEVLIEWLESNESPYGKYYVNTDMESYKTAEQLHGLLTADKAYVIDIRKKADYDAGHIEGSVNLTEDEVSAHLDSEDLSAYSDVVIACTSGQTAAWLTCLLSLEGHKDISSLKFGMCSWNEATASAWNSNINSDKITLFTSDVSEKAPEGDLPDLGTGKETAQEIFDVRLDKMISDGFGAIAITVDQVYANLDDYYIINRWPTEYYLDPGHIDGAIQYTAKQDFKLDADLKTLPTDKTIVVYCYTGQGSGNLVAYLSLVGYDAKTLKYGANAMIHEDMPKSAWGTGMIKDYPLVSTK